MRAEMGVGAELSLLRSLELGYELPSNDSNELTRTDE